MAKSTYEHLRIQRAKQHVPRRTRSGFPGGGIKRDDLSRHGQRLSKELKDALSMHAEQERSREGAYVLSIRYRGNLDLETLSKHGIELISQEANDYCVVFADEKQLAIFQDHLQRLGLEDESLSYRQVLEAFESVNGWTAEDRKSWAVKQYGLPSTESFYLDIELWPIKEAQHVDRQQLCAAFERWLDRNTIVHVDKLNLNSLVLYRVKLNTAQAALLLKHTDVRTVDLPPRTGISYHQKNLPVETIPVIKSPRESASKVCVLDSGVSSGHPLLGPAIGETATFIGTEDGADDNGHGTAVASIALYGDVEYCRELNEWTPEIWILSGKVLDENAEFDPHTIETTIIAAVEYFVRDFQCKIFNLSSGILNRPYQGRRVERLAYVLDDLARKHDILFVVSAGNFVRSDEHEIPWENWREEYPESLLREEARIIDPSTALNAITVGSITRHTKTPGAQRILPEITDISIAYERQPSPHTRRGPSVKGAVKPELVAHGGNVATAKHRPPYTSHARGLGVLACRHDFMGNAILTEVDGTSFAAPYITHVLGRLANAYPEASVNLLRALLMNHADMPQEVKTTFSEEMDKAYKGENKACNGAAIDVAGYGIVNEDNLFRSTEDAVVMLAEEVIRDDESQFFELPIPPDFFDSPLRTREIRISLAYTSSVRATRLEYRASRVSFKLVKGESLAMVQDHFNNELKKNFDTLKEFSGNRRSMTYQARSNGTVQQAVWTCKSFTEKTKLKLFLAITRNDYPWGGALTEEEEPYAVVVTVTDRENYRAKLYTQIQTILRAHIHGRARMTR